MRYFKQEWDRKRDDHFSHWGKCTLYLEVDSEGYPVRQIELYEYGDSLVYDRDHPGDQYGILSDQRVDVSDFESGEISEEEFRKLITGLKPANRGEHVDIHDPDRQVHCDRCRGTFVLRETKPVSGFVEFLTAPGMHVHHDEQDRLYCDECRKKVYFYFLLLLILTLVCIYYLLK